MSYRNCLFLRRCFLLEIRGPCGLIKYVLNTQGRPFYEGLYTAVSLKIWICSEKKGELHSFQVKYISVLFTITLLFYYKQILTLCFWCEAREGVKYSKENSLMQKMWTFQGTEMHYLKRVNKVLRWSFYFLFCCWPREK